MDDYDYNVTDDYIFGTDCLGDGFDFSSAVPWLKMFTGGSSDKSAADAKAALEKAAAEERRRQEEARQRTVVWSIVGVLGAGLAGTAIYLVARK